MKIMLDQSERDRRAILRLPQYNAVAVQKEIEKDRRIKPAEAKRIHALLKGWRP